MANWRNIIMMMSNAAAVPAVLISFKFNDWWTFACIIMAAFFSAVSHLFESHKHGMTGFGCSKRNSRALNLGDIVAAMALVSRSAYIVYHHFPQESVMYYAQWFGVLWSIAIFSESDYSADTMNRYMIFHTIWHLGVFSLLYLFLMEYYESQV